MTLQPIYLKFDFVIISLKTTIWSNHETSDHQNRKKWALGVESPQRLINILEQALPSLFTFDFSFLLLLSLFC